MQDTFENRLMSTSLAVTIVNLGIGAVSRIPAENILNMADHQKDALAMKILIIGANTLVIGLLAGKIDMSLMGKKLNCNFYLLLCIAVIPFYEILTTQVLYHTH